MKKVFKFKPINWIEEDGSVYKARLLGIDYKITRLLDNKYSVNYIHYSHHKHLRKGSLLDYSTLDRAKLAARNHYFNKIGVKEVTSKESI